MPTLRHYRILTWLGGIVLISLLAACGSSPLKAELTPTRPANSVTPGVTATLNGGNPPALTTTAGATAPVPPTQTRCPATNTGRPAVIAPLTLGQDQALLYTVETQGIGSGAPPASIMLYRYDATTGAKTTLLRFSHEFFNDPQISADGQWLLFITNTSFSAPAKLQLIRMDGQGLQTLYCGSISSAQWSADQKLVSFTSTDKGSGLYLLNLQSGSVERELDFLSPLPRYVVVTWLDSTRLYLDTPGIDAPAGDILILDTSKGTDQKPSGLIPVFQTQNPSDNLYAFVNFDSSYDGKSLFISVYSREKGSSNGSAAPSSIETLPPTGGKAQILFASSTLAIPALRVINSNSLCLLVENLDGDTSQNGLWKMNVDGTGLSRLISFGNGTVALFNEIAQFPWSNFSRDSSLYGIWTESSHGLISKNSLLVGSLQGGAPTIIESAGAASMQVAIVGWTTV